MGLPTGFCVHASLRRQRCSVRDHMSEGGTVHVASHRACPHVSSLSTGQGGTRCLCSHMQTQAGACAAFGQGRLLFFISFSVRLTYSLSRCLNLSLVLLQSLNHPRLVFLSASHSRILHQALPLLPSPTLPLLLSPATLHAAFLPPVSSPPLLWEPVSMDWSRRVGPSWLFSGS